MTKEASLREAVVFHARSLFERGFSVGSAGNISVRLDDGILITPTNSSLGTLDGARLTKIDLDGRHVAGDPPSKEIHLHRAFYESRPGTGAVVHLHSTYATALSCLVDLQEDDCLPNLTPYARMRVGKVRRLPYRPPGSPELGDLIRGLEGRCAAVLLDNHGPVVSGVDLPSTVHAIEELEETAKLSFILRGQHVRLLPSQCAPTADASKSSTRR